MRCIWIVVILVFATAGCVDKLSEEGRTCPCAGSRTCCFSECVDDQTDCTVEKRIGVPGGTVTAADGTTLEIPFGALSEDTLITVRAVPDLVLPDGITKLGEAVVVEPEGLTLAKPAILTLPYDNTLIPSGAEPNNVRVREAMSGSSAFRGVGETEVDAVQMRAEIERFYVFVPAVIDSCDGVGYSRSGTDCGIVEVTIDGADYGVHCDLGDPTTSCSCVKDGETVKTVDAPCPGGDTWVPTVYRFECGFPCAPPEFPDGPPDAGVGPDAAPGG